MKEIKEANKQQYELGVSLYKKGNINSAVEQLLALIEVFPESPWSRKAKKKIKIIRKIQGEDGLGILSPLVPHNPDSLSAKKKLPKTDN